MNFYPLSIEHEPFIMKACFSDERTGFSIGYKFQLWLDSGENERAFMRWS